MELETRSNESPPAAVLTTEENELCSLDLLVDQETIELRQSAAEYVFSQMSRPAEVAGPVQLTTHSDSSPSLSLAQVAMHIQSAGLPNTLAEPSMLSQPCGLDAGWKRLLTGGEQVPVLEMARSHKPEIVTEVVWDIDGMLSSATLFIGLPRNPIFLEP
jgi:hypothetical protein